MSILYVIDYKKVALEKRPEQILAEMEMNNKQVKRLRKVKKKLFSKVNLCTKEILLKYEELESIARTIAVKTVYIQAINDTLKKIIIDQNKELDSIQIKINDDVINYIAHSEEVSNKDASSF